MYAHMSKLYNFFWGLFHYCEVNERLFIQSSFANFVQGFVLNLSFVKFQ